MDVMTNDDRFFNYICDSNEKMGKIQALNLKKIQAFATNPNLHDLRQADLITDCLKYWNIPEHTRIMYAGEQPSQHQRAFQKGQPRQKVKIVSAPVNHKQLLHKLNNELRSSKLNWDLNSLLIRIKELNSSILEENFKKYSIFDHKCFISCGTLVLPRLWKSTSASWSRPPTVLTSSKRYTHTTHFWNYLFKIFLCLINSWQLIIRTKFNGSLGGGATKNVIFIRMIFLMNGSNLRAKPLFHRHIPS